MNHQDRIEFKLRSALNECELHHKRLHSAWLDAVTFPTIEKNSTNPFTDTEVRTLDQLVFRFGKLQDAMGGRLLPNLLKYLHEWQDHEPFLDKLNRAEKLGIVSSVEQWIWLRELRNQTAHEYPEQADLVMANLKRLVAHVSTLEKIYAQLAKVARQQLQKS